MLILTLTAILAGCVMEMPTNGTEDEDGASGESTVAAKSEYTSAGGTSGLAIGSAESGAAQLSSFDPGAFVLSTQADVESESDGLSEPAEFDGGAPPPNNPPPPPPNNPPPPPNNPPPPPAGGDNPPPPPPGGNGPGPAEGAPPPAGDPNQPPPPPPDGNAPPPNDPNNPPPDGDFPPGDPNNPPPDGGFPPGDPNQPPPEGGFPPGDPNNPPPDGGFPPGDPNQPPPEGGFPPFDPNQPPPEGGFPPFDPNQPPPFNPDFPPPPEGFEQFPGGFEISDDFLNFINNPPPGGPGGPGGPNGPPNGEFVPLPFNEIPFGDFLQDFSLEDVIPNAPPPFAPGAFGDFAFGDVPPPPAGFPPFPPPRFDGAFGGFGSAFGPPLGDGAFPPPPGDGPFPPGGPEGPNGPPPNLPPEFFEFNERLNDLNAFVDGFDFLPPPLPPGGEFPPDGPFPPDGQFPGDGGPPLPPQFAFIKFEDVAEFLPPDFLPPEEAIQIFENFGMGHPLIGDGGLVNPDLEQAFEDRPPLPKGFDGFDFDGQCPQFDDLFTVYDEELVGVPMSGQINSTVTEMLDNGMELRCSDTTIIESVLGESTPLIQVEEGLLQTQWTVNIRELKTTMFQVIDPDDPGAFEEFEQTTEKLSQMTWTMVMQEMDTDDDGVPDMFQVSGDNTIKVIEETADGGPPEGFPPLPPPPDLLLPFEFQGVLDLGGGTEEEAPPAAGDEAVPAAGDEPLPTEQ